MIVVLASYPKSGNTWLRSLINNYVYDEKVPLNQMAKTVPSDASAVTWESVGLKDIAVDKEALKLRGQFYKKAAEYAGNRRFYLKSHSANLTIDGNSLFDHKYLDKVIHIVRNPFDVLPSLAHHFGLNIEDAYELMTNDQNMMYEEGRKMYPEFQASWGLHTNSWLHYGNEHPENYLFVRYEDLKLNPFTTLKKIMEFVEEDISEEKLVNAIYNSNFKVRKAEEEKDGFIERAAEDRQFFRKGQIGGFVDEVPRDIVEKLYEKYSEICKALSYNIKL